MKHWKPLSIPEPNLIIYIISELLSPERRRPIVAATVALNGLQSLLRFLRLDNRNTSARRKTTDKLAASHYIREIFQDV